MTHQRLITPGNLRGEYTRSNHYSVTLTDTKESHCHNNSGDNKTIGIQIILHSRVQSHKLVKLGILFMKIVYSLSGLNIFLCFEDQISFCFGLFICCVLCIEFFLFNKVLTQTSTKSG